MIIPGYLIKIHKTCRNSRQVRKDGDLERDTSVELFDKSHGKSSRSPALVAITLMIVESKPEEKETMIHLVMNFLT